MADGLADGGVIDLLDLGSASPDGDCIPADSVLGHAVRRRIEAGVQQPAEPGSGNGPVAAFQDCI